jgi:capsular polysaccharide biosynthesis protein
LFEPTVIESFRRYWRFVFAIVVVVVIPFGLYVSTRSVVYTANASLIVSDPRGPGVLDGQNLTTPSRYVADQLRVFASGDLAARASERAKALQPPLGKSPSWFLAHASASASAIDNNVISVAVKGSSAAQAKAAADAVVLAYGDVVKQSMVAQASAIQSQLDSAIAGLNTALVELAGRTDGTSSAKRFELINNRGPLEGRRAQVAAEALHPSAGINFALLPNGAQSSSRSAAARTLLLAIVIGMLLGLALAYARARRDHVFSHNGDPESVLDAPLLIDVSTLPLVNILGRAAPNERQVSRLAQLFGTLASFIADELRRRRESSGTSIAVVSPEGGAACTAVAWNTALALSAQGLKVLLVDADGSWQAAPPWLKSATQQVEWVERLDRTIDLVELTWTADRPVCFAAKPPEVRFPTSMGDVFRHIEQRCDVVLIVPPQYLDSSYTAVLTAAAGHAIVVASEAGSITNAQELARRLRLNDATTLGYLYAGRRTAFERAQPTVVEAHDGLDGPELTRPLRLADHKRPKHKDKAPVIHTPDTTRSRPVATPTPDRSWPRPVATPDAQNAGHDDPPHAPSVPARPNPHPATLD